jgi:general stress protein 26
MSKDLTPAKAEEAFWDSLKKSNTGLLGLDQPGYHAQPMTAFREEETGTIWFFTRDDTDLARDATLAGGQSAMFHYGSKDQNVWACIHGQLSSQGQDREIIDRYWNPVLAAWYPEGKDDPHLTILRFDADDGRVWVNEGGFFKFAFEIA